MSRSRVGPAWLVGVVLVLLALVSVAAVGVAFLAFRRFTPAGQPDVAPRALDEPEVELRFGGACRPNLSRPLGVQRTNSQLHVASHATTPAHAITIRPGAAPLRGRVPLTTAAWLADPMQVGVMTGEQIWWNFDPAAASGGADRIRGELEFRSFDAERGLVDVTFRGVTLLRTLDGSVCTVDGRLTTHGLRWER